MKACPDILGTREYTCGCEHTVTVHMRVGTERLHKSGLSDAQKKVLLHLAQKGPKSGYDLFRKDGVISNSTWFDVKRSLDSDGGTCLIAPLGVLRAGFRSEHDSEKARTLRRDYEANRTAALHRKEEYWLTSIGIGEALGLGADPRRLARILKDCSIKDETSSLIVDLAIAGGPEWSGEQLNERTAVAIALGSLDVELPEEPTRRIAFLSAIWRHQTLSNEFARNYAMEAEELTQRSTVFSNEDAWKAEIERWQKRERDPIWQLRYAAKKGLSKISALALLRGKGMSGEEAEAVLKKMVSVGSLYESMPDFFRSF